MPIIDDLLAVDAEKRCELMKAEAQTINKIENTLDFMVASLVLAAQPPAMRGKSQTCRIFSRFARSMTLDWSETFFF